MPFLGIGTSDTGMSVFAVLIGRNEKAKMSFILKNGKKKTGHSCVRQEILRTHK
jgi:hypothetical protein